VAWWKAEGDASSSVGTNHGALQNGATFALGQIGQAFSLDGTNDYVSSLDSPTLRPANLTIEGWFSFGATNGTRTLVSKAVGTGTLNSYMLRLNNGTRQGWVSDNSGSPPIVSYAGFQPLSNQWYHLAYPFQDSAGQLRSKPAGELRAAVRSGLLVGCDDSHVHCDGCLWQQPLVRFQRDGRGSAAARDHIGSGNLYFRLQAP
jgi:hypothetical protein